MPNHIAIILDGNRRWAKRNLTIQEKGHFKGADAVENLLDWCEEFDIKIITLYVLSAENLQRKNEELDYLYELIHKRLEKLYNDPRLHKNKICFVIVKFKHLSNNRNNQHALPQDKFQ